MSTQASQKLSLQHCLERELVIDLIEKQASVKEISTLLLRLISKTSEE